MNAPKNGRATPRRQQGGTLSLATLEMLRTNLLSQSLPLADPGFAENARIIAGAIAELDAAIQAHHDTPGGD